MSRKVFEVGATVTLVGVGRMWPRLGGQAESEFFQSYGREIESQLMNSVAKIRQRLMQDTSCCTDRPARARGPLDWVRAILKIEWLYGSQIARKNYMHGHGVKYPSHPYYPKGFWKYFKTFGTCSRYPQMALLSHRVLQGFWFSRVARPWLVTVSGFQDWPLSFAMLCHGQWILICSATGISKACVGCVCTSAL